MNRSQTAQAWLEASNAWKHAADYSGGISRISALVRAAQCERRAAYWAQPWWRRVFQREPGLWA